ncbi:dead end protein homolog 1 isoform X1 [Anser cygnoides]|uniref:dead end protein homolog 1 isoform X1 n=2 Tax=Anser cygnoides TaxID=8845 RepID=UPI000670C6B8
MEEEAWADSINQANKMALLNWVRETGIDLVQINGQRRYGGPPPGWVGSPPPAGSEVFIGKLPQEMYENTLIPLFQSVGKLYEFRLMMTFSGLNRGFAYAKYSSWQGAKEAIATLNNLEVQEGCTIVVCKSLEKCELSVDGLPTSVNQKGLEAVVLGATEGVLSITLHASPYQKKAKFAVLKYSSHQAAAMAKKTLMEGNVRLCGENVKVGWLKPELKEKLQLCKEKRGEHLGSPEQVLLSLKLCNVLDCLNTLCRQQCLGTPRFFTKCVQVKPSGWLQYWCQLVIPAWPLPFSAFLWVQEDVPSTSGHEKAKDAVARLALRKLGCLLT